MVPSEQLRLQSTLSGNAPPEQVISEKINGAAGGEGGEGCEGGEGGEGGEGEGDAVARSTGSHCGGQPTPRAEGRAFELR